MVIRKFSAVIPALFMMIIALAGCKNDGSTAIPRETKSAEELAQLEKEQEEAKQTSYAALIQTHTLCSNVAAKLVNAYSFSKNEAANYDNEAECLTAFCPVTGLNRQEVTEAATAVRETLKLEDKSLPALLQDGNAAVAIVRQALTAQGTYSNMEQQLDRATEALKGLSSNFAGYTAIKSYYFDLVDYVAYCISPVGSYQDLGVRVEEFESALAESRYKLERFME